MKPLKEQIEELRGHGYSAVLASAKVVHDVVLLAIARSGFKANGTLKGGVVMSALTKDIRRATLDMDIDFIHHPISEAGVKRFVKRLARSMPELAMSIRGRVIDLKHEDYRGKRIFLAVKDNSTPRWIRTKMDIGVHTHEAIKQVNLRFDVPSEEGFTNLQANSTEQIFAEKLLSLLRHGVVSKRPKDVFDLYYLSDKVSIRKLKPYVRELIYENKRCRANSKSDVIRMLGIVFAARPFLRLLNNTKANWLQIEPSEAIAGIWRLVKKV